MKAARIGEAEIERSMLDMARARLGCTIEPTEIARALVGGNPDDWGPLMPVVRRVAVRLMKAGPIVITRRGRPVDPDDFRGTYRLAAAPEIMGEETKPPSGRSGGT